MIEKKVALIKTSKCYYPIENNFRPSIAFPEYPFIELSKTENHVYEMIREGFRMMGYDIENYGSVNWNPLGDLIKPGDKVLIKPNMVMDKNRNVSGNTDCLYTQPSLVAAVIDYVIIALKGYGSIIVGDAPVQECNFKNLIKMSGYEDLIEYYRKKLYDSQIIIELHDFRGLFSKTINGINHTSVRDVSSTTIDLAEESEFSDQSAKYFEKMRITNYDPALLKKHHNQNKHEYLINDNVLIADVVINMPKPKTHRKAGVTISLKNIVGINTRKEYLPHHVIGSIEEGGDEYQEKSILKEIRDKLLDKRNYYAQTAKRYNTAKFFAHTAGIINRTIKFENKDEYLDGSWYGNDTISKTIIDLNKILFYSDKMGVLQEKKQRKYLIIADMIISGEKEGPLAPLPKDVGIIAIGEDPVCFDEVILKLMGAKKEYIHTIEHARNVVGNYILTEGDSYPYLLSNKKEWNKKKIEEISDDSLLYFVPTSGWKEAFYCVNE